MIISNSIGNHSTPLVGCDFTGQVQTATASGEEKDQLAAEITTALTQETFLLVAAISFSRETVASTRFFSCNFFRVLSGDYGKPCTEWPDFLG